MSKVRKKQILAAMKLQTLLNANFYSSEITCIYSMRIAKCDNENRTEP